MMQWNDQSGAIAPRNSAWRRVKQTVGMALAMIVAGSSWGLPAQAQKAIDPVLKEQVLQIIRDNPEVILEAVQAYQKQQQQARENARQAFLKRLQTEPQSIVGQSPTRGAPKAKVVLVEFSDFQCPFCAKAHPALDAFMKKHQDKVMLVYKHLPLVSIHPNALPAAKAAWAAGQQGKFWEFHNALFAQQDQLGEELYQAIAKNLKLDLAKFERDRTSEAASAAIMQDIRLAEALGVDSTPFFIMNGRAFSGALEVSDLEQVLAEVSR